jgi:hypothetical protein
LELVGSRTELTLESLAVLPEGSTLVLGSLDRLLEGIALAEGEVHGKPDC